MRGNKKNLNKANRDLERDRRDMDKRERELVSSNHFIPLFKVKF